jgi:predicted DNA-binding transcriptional regulator YafY
MGCRSGRSQIVRLWKLWRRLQGLAMTPRIADLAREFQVSPRVIYRDLRTLKDAGERVPVSWYHDGWPD